MIVDKDTARLICKLEYELGSQTYNPHSYNGWTGEEGCGFKYPVKYCKNKNALIKQELTKNKNEINYIDPQCINTMKYAFGLNHLYVGKGIIKMLECLEEVYNIDFNKLEQKRLEKKKKALVKNQENLDKGKRIKIGPGKFKIGIDMARVGDRTRTQERILRNDSKVKHTTLEFNSGGHFADAQKRLAKAVKWLLECT